MRDKHCTIKSRTVKRYLSDSANAHSCPNKIFEVRRNGVVREFGCKAGEGRVWWAVRMCDGVEGKGRGEGCRLFFSVARFVSEFLQHSK